MKIDFCDLCNESVPASDLEAGRAVRIKDRVVCSRCEQLMHSRAAAEAAAAAALAEATAPAPAAVPIAPAVVVAPGASSSTGGAGALVLAVAALLCALGVGYWLYDRGEKTAKEQQARIASLGSELGELRSRNESLRVQAEQRAAEDRQA